MHSCGVHSLHKGTRQAGVHPSTRLCPPRGRAPFPNSPLEGPMAMFLPRGTHFLINTRAPPVEDRGESPGMEASPQRKEH